MATYLELLKIKNRYISDMHEDFITEMNEQWGQVYHDTYNSLRELIVEKQLYISNELEKFFSEFRNDAAQYTKEADLIESLSNYSTENSPREDPALDAAYLKFSTSTGEHMAKVMAQIESDFTKLRSRIELDKA